MNYGVLIRGDPSGASGDCKFYSSDYTTDSSMRPKLEATYYDGLTVTGVDRAPPTVSPGAGNIVMEQLVLTASNADGGQITVTGITVTFVGDSVSDIASGGVKIYDDVNDNGISDSGTDILLGTGSFSGSTAAISIMDPLVEYGTPERLLICYDISSGALYGNAVKC